jgi:hypothetical protein
LKPQFTAGTSKPLRAYYSSNAWLSARQTSSSRLSDKQTHETLTSRNMLCLWTSSICLPKLQAFIPCAAIELTDFCSHLDTTSTQASRGNGYNFMLAPKATET